MEEFKVFMHLHWTGCVMSEVKFRLKPRSGATLYSSLLQHKKKVITRPRSSLAPEVKMTTYVPLEKKLGQLTLLLLEHTIHHFSIGQEACKALMGSLITSKSLIQIYLLILSL